MHPQTKQTPTSRQNPTLQRSSASALNRVASTGISTSRSHSRSASSNRRHSHKIPDDLDKNAVFYPKYNVEKLINTKNTERRNSDRPPRPPNSFFLMKNALLLTLRERNLKVKMPELCRKARDLWDEAPKDSKQFYEELSSKAERLHHIKYPGYTYRPVRRQIFQQYSPMLNSAGGMVSSFPVEDPVETVIMPSDEPTTTYSITITTPSDSPTTPPSLTSSPETQISLTTPLSSPNYLMVIPTPEASTTPLYSPTYHFTPVSPVSISEPVILDHNHSWNVGGEYEDFSLTSQQPEGSEISIDHHQAIVELNNSNIEEVNLLLSQIEGYMWDNQRNDI